MKKTIEEKIIEVLQNIDHGITAEVIAWKLNYPERVVNQFLCRLKNQRICSMDYYGNYTMTQPKLPMYVRKTVNTD